MNTGLATRGMHAGLAALGYHAPDSDYEPPPAPTVVITAVPRASSVSLSQHPRAEDVS